MKVVSVKPEASTVYQVVPKGYLFEDVILQVTRIAKSPAAPSLTRDDALLGSNIAARSSITGPMCIPTRSVQPYNDDVYRGGTVQMGDCISVPTSDKRLALGISSMFTFNNATTWFAIK